MDSQTNIYYIFLGAVLTFLATALVEVVKNRLFSRSKSKNFKVFLKLELESIKTGLTSFQAKFESSNYYDFMLLGIVDSGVSNLEESRKEGVFLKTEQRQKDFFNLVSGLSLYAKDARTTENVFSNERKNLKEKSPAIFSDLEVLEKAETRKRNELSMKLIELKRQIDEFVEEL